MHTAMLNALADDLLCNYFDNSQWRFYIDLYYLFMLFWG